MSDIKKDGMNSFLHKRNEAKIEQAEKELSELMGGSDEQDADEVQHEGTEEQQEEVVNKDIGKEEDPKEELSAEEKSFKKRYGDIRRHMQEKEQEWTKRLGTLEEQLSKATKNELVLPKSKEDIAEWASKFPDVAGIVEAIADQKANERTADLDSRLKEIESMRVTAKKEKAEAELLKLHPDFEDIRKDDAFHEWAGEQPQVYQDALYDNADDVRSVARVIDMYKSDMGIKTKKVSADKGAAASVKTRQRTVVDAEESSKVLSESQVKKMSLKEYEARQEEIMDAMRSGKFIYDLSK
jgi:hypothetical protein